MASAFAPSVAVNFSELQHITFPTATVTAMISTISTSDLKTSYSFWTHDFDHTNQLSSFAMAEVSGPSIRPPITTTPTKISI